MDIDTLLSKLLAATAGGAVFEELRNHGPGKEVVRLGYMYLITEPAYLDSLGIKLQALFLVGEELLDIFALITLKLDHLSHLSIDDDGAIASYCDKSDLCAYNNHIQEEGRTYRTSS